jgi:hypothetical protein
MEKLSEKQIAQMAFRTFQAEREMQIWAKIVLESEDTLDETTVAEEQYQIAIKKFKNLYQQYEEAMKQYQEETKLHQDTAEEIYHQTKQSISQTVGEPSFEQFQHTIHEVITNVEEDYSDTTSESVSVSSEEENSIPIAGQAQMRRSVADLRNQYEKPGKQKKPDSSKPFQEVKLSGENVSKEVNRIQYREHLQKLQGKDAPANASSGPKYK